MLKNNLLTDKQIGSAKVIIDLIPESNKSGRPGTIQRNTFITIHNTGNASPTADAEAHTEYVDKDTSRYVSWHFTVDENEIFQELPVNEKGYHAGTKDGNNKSIGIEACENNMVAWPQTRKNLIDLVVVLMIDMQIPIERVVPHKYWSGKYCPHIILNDGWDKFIDDVKKAYSAATKKEEKNEETKSEKVNKILKEKLKDPEGWAKAIRKLKEIAERDECPEELKILKYVDDFILGINTKK